MGSSDARAAVAAGSWCKVRRVIAPRAGAAGGAAGGSPKRRAAAAVDARASPSWRAVSPPTAPATTTRATQALRGAIGKDLRSKDWALFVLGESEFYDGNYRAAREAFEKVARGKGRPAQMAPFRIADCLWMEGDRAKAAASYARLAKTASARTGDAALARFRVAEVAADRDRDAARPQFLAIARDFPAHPLADEALRRLGAGTPATPLTTPAPPPVPATTPSITPPASDLAPGDRLRRAESLSKDRHWDEALAELAKLPATLPPELAAERDYQIGMTKFHMRRDYPTAGALLLGAVDQLARASAEKAASAQFHGARALSRVGPRRRGDRRLPQGDRAVSALALGGRGAVPVGVARVQPRALPREHPGVPGDAGQVRRQRVRRRRRLEPGVRAFPARQHGRGGRGSRSLRPPAPDRHRLRRDRRAREILARAHQGEGRARRTRPRPATASSRSAGRFRSTACWRARASSRRASPCRSSCRSRRWRSRRRANRCASRRWRARPS